jgi:hypothetical protein
VYRLLHWLKAKREAGAPCIRGSLAAATTGNLRETFFHVREKYFL